MCILLLRPYQGKMERGRRGGIYVLYSSARLVSHSIDNQTIKRDEKSCEIVSFSFVVLLLPPIHSPLVVFVVVVLVVFCHWASIVNSLNWPKANKAHTHTHTHNTPPLPSLTPLPLCDRGACENAPAYHSHCLLNIFVSLLYVFLSLSLSLLHSLSPADSPITCSSFDCLFCGSFKFQLVDVLIVFPWLLANW